MTQQVSSPGSGPFAYRAQTRDGQEISGTIDAADEADAQRRLQSLFLQNIQIRAASTSSRPGALRGEDFLVFNQQLAQLTGAGLPVEQGLRLVAREMRRGSMLPNWNREKRCRRRYWRIALSFRHSILN
jgi:type II secretory pathway component PulF